MLFPDCRTSPGRWGEEYDAAGDLRDSVLKLLLLEGHSHSFAVVRASELRRWVEAGSYTTVLAGDYPRSADDDKADITVAAQEATHSYADRFRQSQDALSSLVRDVSGVFGSVRGWVGGVFNGKGGQDERSASS